MILTLGTTPAVQRVMVFEGVKIGQVVRAAEVIEAPAGKAVNAAWVVRALGREVTALGFAGGDRGRFLLRRLDGAGIGHRFVEVAAQTRQCVTVVDRLNHTHTELIEDSARVEPADVAKLLSALEELLPTASVLVLSGTLAPGCGDAFYFECCRRAATAGVRVVLDAKGAPLREALAARPDIVKPNREELGQTLGLPVGDDGQVEAAIGHMVQLGARGVVVTLGAAGAMAGDGQHTWRLGSPAVDVVNTIGSGDSFAAGLAVALADGRDVPDACRLGIACGAANAMTLQAGDVDARVVRDLEQRVVIAEE